MMYFEVCAIKFATKVATNFGPTFLKVEVELFPNIFHDAFCCAISIVAVIEARFKNVPADIGFEDAATKVVNIAFFNAA